MVLEEGQRFTLRDGAITLGTGVVTKVLAQLNEVERLALTEGKKAREKKAVQATSK
jgi:elongation factor Tu